MKWTSYLAAAGVAASLAAVSVSAVEAQDTTAAVRQEQADSSHRMHGERVRGAERMRGAERERAADREGRAERMREGRRGGARMMAQGRMAGPAERLLEQRAELGLSAEQVQRLEGIRDSYAEKNKPYVEELAKLREARRAARAVDSGDVKPRVADPRRAEARAAMESLRANREAARKEAYAVLTDAQRKQVQEKMKDRRERRADRPAGAAQN